MRTWTAACCGFTRLLAVLAGVFLLFSLDRDAQRTQKVQIVLGKRCCFVAGLGINRSRLAFLPGYFVEADGRLQHEQHIEAMLANILHHPGNLFALDHRLVDGLAQLLNQFTQTGCHKHLRAGGRRERCTGSGMRFSLPYFHCLRRATGKTVRACAQQFGMDRCYHHNGMKAQRIGRALGIGMRVAGRIAGQRLNGAGQPAATTRSVPQTTVRVAARTGRGLAQGAGGFWRALRRVSGIVLLEVTGVFFLLPVLVFGPTLWRTRMSWAHGPDHRTFVVSAIIVVLFLYLGVTSFWRAHRRSAAGRA